MEKILKYKKFSYILAVFLLLFIMIGISWAATGSYTVTWNAVTDPDVTEVRIFRSATAGNYDFNENNPNTIIVPMPATEGTVTDIPNGTWYFLPVPYAGTLQGGLCIEQNELTETFLTAPSCLNGVAGQKLIITLEVVPVTP